MVSRRHMLFLTSSCGIRVISKPTLPLTILSCRYLYTSHIEVTNFNLFSLMHAASKFQLDHLQSKCAQFLRGKINMGVILSRKEGGTIHGFLTRRPKNYCIVPFFAQFLPRHATSKLGLSKKNRN